MNIELSSVGIVEFTGTTDSEYKQQHSHSPVLGQRALTAMPSLRNSSAMPSTHIDMPYLAIVYATWFWNQCGDMFRGGLRFKMWGFTLFFRWGMHVFDLKIKKSVIKIQCILHGTELSSFDTHLGYLVSNSKVA